MQLSHNENFQQIWMTDKDRGATLKTVAGGAWLVTQDEEDWKRKSVLGGAAGGTLRAPLPTQALTEVNRKPKRCLRLFLNWWWLVTNFNHVLLFHPV